MSTSSPRRTRQKRGARVSASPRRHAASTLVVALAFALVAGATAPAAAAPTTPSAAATAPVFDAEYLDGVSGAEPAEEVNLAGTWDFTPLTNTICTGGGRFGTTTGPFLSCVDSPAGGGPTTIQVPGGGWVKQGWTDLSRATYAKTISIPKFSADQVTRLNFGAINHRATVTVDGRTVGTQTTSFTNSVFDLTGFVTPGAEHRIEVTVEGRKALVGPDLRYTVPEGASWSDDVAQGIFRSANLEVFPAVFVADTFVRTSRGRQDAQLRRSGHEQHGSGAEGRSHGGTELLERSGLEVPGGPDPARCGAGEHHGHHHGRPAALARRRGLLLDSERPVPGGLHRPASRARREHHVPPGWRRQGQRWAEVDLRVRGPVRLPRVEAGR